MGYCKINKRGQITIPKYIRDKYGWTAGMPLDAWETNGALIVKPLYICYRCKKALPEELADRGSCLSCLPPKMSIIH